MDNVQSIYDQEMRRRRLQEALLQQSMPQGTQYTGGPYSRAVPYSPLQGLSTLGQALITRQGRTASEKRIEEAIRAQEEKRKRLAESVLQTYTGTPAVPGRPEQPYEMTGMEQFGDEQIPGLKTAAVPEVPAVPGDPMRAMLQAAASPETERMASVLAALERGKPQQGSMFYTYETDNKGNLWRLPGRPGENAEMVLTNEGKPVQPAKYSPTRKGDIKGAEEREKLKQQLTYKPQIAGAEVTAKELAKRQIEKPKWKAKIASASDRLDLIRQKIKETKDNTGYLSTGVMSQLTGWIGGTPAKDQISNLATLRAIAGFNELRELKEAGGTLGQVSNVENELLQSTWNNLEASQSKEQFLKNLDAFRQQAELSWKRINTAYENLYGEKLERKSTVATRPEEIPEDLWSVMTPEEKALWTQK